MRMAIQINTATGASLLTECNQETPRDFRYNCLCCTPSRRVIPFNATIENRKKDFYFAHDDGSNKKGSLETYQHQTAKKIIEEATEISLPRNKTLTYSKTEIEKLLDHGLRPDVILDGIVGVEIWFSNQKKAIEKSKYQNAGLEAIEIDVRNVKFETPMEEFKRIVLTEQSTRTYLFEKQEQTSVSPTSVSTSGFWEVVFTGALLWVGYSMVKNYKQKRRVR